MSLRKRLLPTGLRRRLSLALDRRHKLHFLHIGKTAGSQIGHLCESVNAASKDWRFVKQHHRVRLADLPRGAAYVFGIRHPVSRFRSAFYSRKRKGQPRNYNEWSPEEARAFARFDHANDLAEALFEDSADGRAALAAMLSIKHVSTRQTAWFEPHGTFLRSRPPLAILRQEHLAADLAALAARIGLDCPLTPTPDPVVAHHNDYRGAPELSARAVDNVERWYAADIAFVGACEAWIAAQR
ncbi:MAG: sulfotransferase family 2 domain-containing protein [Sedimentitalea sp.]|nr:sulfotransferase family 2 domain-containing protein [Sedimentitalea sp.]